MPQESLLEEYILNDHGILYQGSADSISATRWYFGQVEEIFKAYTRDSNKKAITLSYRYRGEK